MSPFDRQARLCVNYPVSTEEYLKYITEQIMDWDATSVDTMTEIISELNTKPMMKYFEFPSIIYVIMTNGKDECNAAYCRNMDLVVLPRSEIIRSEERTKLSNVTDWDTTFTHELFHIWSRNHTELRDKLYEIIGYLQTPAVIDLPPELAHLKMTNPDAPITNHYIKIDVNGQEKCLAPILVASGEYDPNIDPNFFSYLETRFIMLDDQTLKSSGNLITYDEVTNLYEKIGKNTEYIIHPEEIMADNFVHLVHETSDLPTPGIIEEMLVITSKDIDQ